MKALRIILIAFLIFTISVRPQIGGQALTFDGNDHASVASAVISGNLTIETWIRTSHTSYQVLIGLANQLPPNSPSSYMPGLAMLSDGKLQARLWQGGVVTTASSYNDGKWHHVAVTLSGTTMALYVDGVSAGNFGFTPNQSWWVYTIIGAGYSTPAYGSSSTGWNYSQASLDESRIWSVARTQQEIIGSMYRELAGSETGLASYFKMDEGSGTVLTNSKSGGTDGSVSGALWKASGALAGPGRVLSFSSASSRKVTTPASLSDAMSGVSQLSVAGWINPSQLVNWQVVFSRVSGGDNTKRVLVQTSGPMFGDNDDFYISVANGTTYHAYTQANLLQAGAWTHFALVFDGSGTGDAERLKLYVNGVQQTITFPTPGAVPAVVHTASEVATIGSENNIAYFNGNIDEVSFWTTALTETQIRDMMCRSLSGSETGLQAYYKFDEVSGTTAYDHSLNGRNGSLINLSFDANAVASTAFNTWIGSESSSGIAGANWSKGSAPVSQNVGIYKWPGGNSLTLNSPFSWLNCYIASASDPVIGSSHYYNGNLFLYDDIDLAGYTIYLMQKGLLFESNARVFGSTGSVQGYYFTIPANSGYRDFQNLGFAVSAPSDILYVEISRRHNAYTNDWGSSIFRNYNITEAAIEAGPGFKPFGGGNPGIRFTYNDQELNGIPENNLILAFSSDNGTTWTTYPGTVNTTENTVTVNEVPSVLGLWTLTNSSSPLPVELANFTSSVNGKIVTLNWETKTEVMNHGFEVERKITGSDWQKTGFVEGHGTSNSPKYYTFSDQPNASGKILYRLKQIDTDGEFEYSPETVVEMGLPAEFALHQNYPNPFNPETVIGYALPVAGAVTLEVYNSIGEKVATLVDGMMEAGDHQVNFRAENLPSGLYFYKINVSGVKSFVAVKKLMLLK